MRTGPSTIGRLWPDPDGCTYRGWKDALAGRPSGAAPNYIRHDPVLWSLYMYGYNAAKEALS